MNSLGKIPVILIISVFLILFMLLLSSWVIISPQADKCEVVTIKITKIYEGSSYDIVFHDSGTDRYYIN